MEKYLTPSDPGAFEGREVLPAPKWEAAMCAQCFGHGGWNLKLNAYGPGAHFKALCDNCSGYGWVPASQGSHIHSWRFQKNLGRCYNRYVCECGQTQDVDSSD